MSYTLMINETNLNPGSFLVQLISEHSERS